MCVVNGGLHGGDFFGVFIGDFNAEFIFQRHHQFHGVKRIGAKVCHEGFFIGDLRLIHAELFGNDFFEINK